MRRKARRLLGWGCFFGWIAFGTSCASNPHPAAETAIRAAIDIIEIICPPETTVGDCTNRVKAWLPSERIGDAGSD